MLGFSTVTLSESLHSVLWEGSSQLQFSSDRHCSIWNSLVFCFGFFVCLFSCCFVLFALEFVLGNLMVCPARQGLSWALASGLACQRSPTQLPSSIFTRAHRRLCYGLLVLVCVPQDCQKCHLCDVLIVSMWDRPLGFTTRVYWEPSSPLPSLFSSSPLLIHSPVNHLQSVFHGWTHSRR